MTINHNAETPRVALDSLTTEAANPEFAELDALDRLTRLKIMNDEDRTVADSVGRELSSISAATEAIVASLRRGGRLIYVGAGTSGRLGVLDSSECPPTFGTDPSLVTAVIAGGRGAMFEAVEGAEDDLDAGRQSMIDLNVRDTDTVVGISASGQAPFVIGAITEAKFRQAATVAVVNNRPSRMESAADTTIAVVVGPEFIAGSTRLKAGTAQKLVLNMLSTNAMIEIGKTYGNRMVDLRASNSKLKARALRMTTEITGAAKADAEAALDSADGNVKLAVLILLTGLDASSAAEQLRRNDGFLRKAIDESRL